jgi:3' terminal RNA ribose 2'-O-methyltransferase Hen1
MLLTISTTAKPATNLGYLLHKNPERLHEFNLAFGRAIVFYPEVTEDRCTAALVVEIDPIGLVRGRRGPAGEGRTLQQYVNDRPYVASSFLSVAIADVFGSALAGKSRERPELVNTVMPFEATVSVVRSRGAGGEDLLRKLFEPLGYQVGVERHALDEAFPDWGESPYFSLKLAAAKTLKELLTHLYVLIPVLDNDKHYWIGDAEVEKLLRHGEGWLSAHPEKEAITRRYLKHRRTLIDDALAQLTDESGADSDDDLDVQPNEEEEVERKLSLNEQRLGAVIGVLKQTGANSVLDLGCGEGRLLSSLLSEKQFGQIVGMDVSHRSLEIAVDKLRFDRMPPLQKQRLKLIQGSLMYRDKRLENFDAAAVVEVIEHLDPPRFAAFERVLFEFAKPRSVIITTPNSEYNEKWETLPAGEFRHKDHRFEWTRQQFESWSNSAAERFDYTVRFVPIGPEDPTLGAPTQMAVFTAK